MFLRTLGGLELRQSPFTRVKPLLLAAYLSVEGVKDRRFVAELFWPDAADHLNSLSRALSQLRKGAPGAVEADEQRLWSNLTSDVDAFREALAARDHARALDSYGGAFLAGIHLDWSVELEEWVYETRESLATRAQSALLAIAEAAATRGRFGEAAARAEAAWNLEGAPAPEPESLVRYHALLAAADHPLATRVRQEAEGYGIDLQLRAGEARSRLRVTFVGRDSERDRLEALPPSGWAWVRGGAGMGKSSLLQSLPGTYVPGRSGLPYATLEPVIGNRLDQSEGDILRHLARSHGAWLVDDWERSDSESRALLARLRDLRPELRVVIASREAAPFGVDLELELGPLKAEALEDYPGVYEATGGLPALVGAALRGEPLEAVVEARLQTLPADAAQTYLGLAMVDEPDPALVRRALGLTAAEMAASLETLIAVGLVDPTGAPRAVAPARDYLEARPLQSAELALRLARQLEGIDAFPLFRSARLLWEDSDLPAVVRAYRAWATELLRRGFPQRAVEVLEKAPDTGELVLLRARAQERAGLFREASGTLADLEESPEVLALKGTLCWRLGRPREAEAVSQQALDGPPEARAEALNTLGHLARSERRYGEAISFASRAATVWRSLGQQARAVGALLNLGVAKALAGEPAEEPFREALDLAGENGLLRARILNNLGWLYEREERLEAARESYAEAAELAEGIGVTVTAAWAWNNMGVLFHRQRETERARNAYRQALRLAQQGGEQRMLGMFMANLAELTSDRDAWEEALRILEEAGHKAEADQYRAELPADHPFRAYAGDGR